MPVLYIFVCLYALKTNAKKVSLFLILLTTKKIPTNTSVVAVTFLSVIASDFSADHPFIAFDRNVRDKRSASELIVKLDNRFHMISQSESENSFPIHYSWTPF